MTLGDWLPNAILVAAALLFSANFAPEQRRQAMTCCGVIAANWLSYVLSWTPFAPHFALKALGVLIPSENIWTIVDTLSAIAVLIVAYERQWAWALWGCLTMQVLKSAINSTFGGEFDAYTRFLDLLFWAQIACFIMGGWRGVWNRLSDIVADLQLPHRKAAPAAARATVRP